MDSYSQQTDFHSTHMESYPLQVDSKLQMEFLSLTNGFQLPIDVFLLPTDGFLLPTNGFQLLKDGFLLPTDGFLLLTNEFQLPKGGFVLPTDGLLLPTDGFQPPKQRFLPPTDGFLLPTHGFLLPLDGFLLIDSNFQTMDSCSPQFPTFPSTGWPWWHVDEGARCKCRWPGFQFMAKSNQWLKNVYSYVCPAKHLSFFRSVLGLVCPVSVTWWGSKFDLQFLSMTDSSKIGSSQCIPEIHRSCWSKVVQPKKQTASTGFVISLVILLRLEITVPDGWALYTNNYYSTSSAFPALSLGFTILGEIFAYLTVF